MTQNREETTLTPGREFFERQIALLKDGVTDDLIDTQYRADATLITFNGSVTGSVQLKEYFREYLKKLGAIQLKSSDKFVETEDTILLEATVQTAMGEARVYDAFVLRDRKIFRHFTGTK